MAGFINNKKIEWESASSRHKKRGDSFSEDTQGDHGLCMAATIIWDSNSLRGLLQASFPEGDPLLHVPS